MNFLFVGADSPGAIERYCAAALRRMGHTVTYHDRQLELTARCRLSRIPVAAELEFRLWQGRYNRRLVERVRREKPEVVFVFKGVELFYETLAELRRMPDRPLIINWNLDSPFDTAPSNTSPDLIRSLPLYDVYFIWDHDLIPPMREAGAPRVEYLPFAYDPACHHPVELSPEERAALTCEIAFVGSYTPARAEMLSKLLAHNPGIWGPNWEHLPAAHPLQAVRRGDYVPDLEMAKVFSAAQITLNFLRPQNGQALNMRSFEAPACGVLMLATRSRDHLALLPEDRAAAYFDSADEMIERAGYYLEHPEERAQVAAEGHRLITSGGHTYDDRMGRLVDILEDC